MSTHYAERYARHKTMQIVQPLDSNGNPEPKRLVFTNAKLAKRLRGIKSWTPHIWQFDDSVVSLSFRYYGNTTLYWVIVYYNGIVDPFEIQPSTIIKIPNIQEVDDVFRALNAQSVVGQTVRI